MTAYRLAHEGIAMPTQVIYDELRREYNSRNPILPNWAKSKDKAGQSPSSSTKPQHALQTEEDKKKKKKRDLSKIECYGCGELGHLRRNCKKDKKKKKKGGGDKEGEKEKSKEEKGDEKSKKSNESKPKSEESQANAVEEIEYAYMAEILEDDGFSESGDDCPDLQEVEDSDDNWDDEDEDNNPPPRRKFLHSYTSEFHEWMPNSTEQLCPVSDCCERVDG
ncbi:hypothetical protein K435DRAFT_804770 [Dendrothele bispora CBS 962.96]|uniref:CCHC-type domain-containing protein n=1 Tax=Dendrothele bispora (strain CBS 962.96) TaxID=1314807 RepID=A0A4S8LDX6_DENBC|nr:hypothetical protein K435DRAFT_804770 [Dendrothele bispora CBS 962.96]